MPDSLGNPTSDDNAINGSSSPADFDMLTGGVLAMSQDPYGTASNGTLNNANTGTGGANPNQGNTGIAGPGIANPPPGGSSYTPPSWLTGLLGSAGNVANTAAQIQGVINGKAVVSPGQAGQPTPNQNAGSNTVVAKTAAGGVSPIVWILGGGAVLWLLMRGK